jgi:predicted nucleic acid-binding Zn ribbon protein|tara:strand:+ start:94 stop:228 length:135 start_codon:yes stop_codon:yes gene_type:complete
MNYNLEEKKKYGFGMNYMMIGIVILVLIVLGGVVSFFMSGENND